MSKPKAPKAPDPMATAAAQTAANVNTAIANAYMGNVNQVTPDGSLTYNQTGTYQMRGPNGDVYDVPTWSVTQKLSPAQQAIYDQTNQSELNLATLANERTRFLNDYMAQPLDLSNEAVENRLMELGRSRLDPMLAERRQTLETDLANRGIKMGSAAYDRAMALNTQGENDLFNQLLLNGRQQAVSEAITQRAQPLNEITALMSGSQVNQPNFAPTSMPSIGTADVAGLIQSGYQNQLADYQRRSAAAGGLFQAGGQIAGTALAIY